MHEAGVIFANNQSSQRAADHRHQRVDRDQPRDFVQRLSAHHVKAKPAHGQDPGAQRQKRDARRWVRRHGAVFTVTVGARAQQQHGQQRQPAADRMHHHAACKVMEFGAGQLLDPALHAKLLVPHNPFKQRVDATHDHRGGDQLRPELGALGNAARDDGRYGSGEGQQKEKLDQLVAVLGGQLLGADQQAGAISHAIADQKVSDGRYRKVHQYFDQGVDLVFPTHRAQLKKRKTGVHGQHHDGAKKNEQAVCALF